MRIELQNVGALAAAITSCFIYVALSPVQLGHLTGALRVEGPGLVSYVGLDGTGLSTISTGLAMTNADFVVI